MKRRRADAGLVLELLGGDARRRGAEDRRCPPRRKTWPTAWVAVVLPAPARPTTQTTRLGLVATSRTIASCSAERTIPSARSIASSAFRSIDGRSRLAAALDERERRVLDLRRARWSSSGPACPGSGPRRRARRRRCATSRAARRRTRSAVAPPRWACAQAITASGSENAVCFSVRPCGPSIRPAIRSSSSRDGSSSETRPRSAGEFACAESVLGGPCAPVLAQRGRGRRAPSARASRAPRPGPRRSPPCPAAVELARRPARGGSRTRGSPRRARDAARPCPCAASPTRRRACGSARRAAGPGRGSRRRAGRSSGSARRRARATRRRSGVCAMLATITCVCRCGSCARLVRCWNAAATNPPPCSRMAPLRAAPGHARLVLEVGERRLPRRLVRLVDRAAGLLVAERVEQADALRRREDEVEPGDRRELLRLDPALVGQRVDPLDRDHPRLRVPREARSSVCG